MGVYVDDMNARYGRMKMSHMVADTTEELLAMADKIGVDRRWLQNAGTHQEHFDVCGTKKQAAIDLGAALISSRDLSYFLADKRNKIPTTEVQG